MKRSKLILLAFLAFLFIGPSIIVAEPNMTKDFSIAEEWYDEEWPYRKIVLIEGSNGAGWNYQVNITVPYDSDMQSDFDDILFTEDDKITLLDHWRESYIESTSAVFWVEVTHNLDSNQELYMYWGNDAVGTASSGTDTFLFYEDWSSQSLDAWTVPGGQADGQTTFSVTDATQGGYVARVEGDPADGYLIFADYNYTAPFATMFRANIEEATTGNTGRMGTGWAGAYGWAFIQTGDPNEVFSVFDDDSNADHQTMTNEYMDSWVTFQVTRDGTEANLYADTVLIETASFDPDIIENPVCSIQVIDSEDDIYSDWVAVRKFVTVEPEFASFGDKEYLVLPEWKEAGEAELVFSVPVDETGLNLLLIFLGLCMIPFSTLYLVKGGKSGMSSDKLFYGLIAFVMGWALFLGGIYG